MRRCALRIKIIGRAETNVICIYVTRSFVNWTTTGYETGRHTFAGLIWLSCIVILHPNFTINQRRKGKSDFRATSIDWVKFTKNNFYNSDEQNFNIHNKWNLLCKTQKEQCKQQYWTLHCWTYVLYTFTTIWAEKDHTWIRKWNAINIVILLWICNRNKGFLYLWTELRYKKLSMSKRIISYS